MSQFYVYLNTHRTEFFIFVFLLIVIALLAFIIPYMSQKKWLAYFAGHQILLQNTVKEVKLYIDGDLRDTNTATTGGEVRGSLEEKNGVKHIVLGVVKQGFLETTLIGQIFVDDKQIGGDF